MQISVNSQRVAQYVLLPGILPRIRGVLGTSFAFLSFGFANCFDMVRLLPVGHPYLNPANYGTFSMLDVIRAAAANLKFDLKHLDQVLVFFAILTAFVTFILMFATAFLYALATPANAMPTTVGGLMASIYQYTDTPNPQQDIALQLLDRVMGVTGNTPTGTFFGSNVSQTCPGGQLGAPNCTVIPAFPTPFHNALHALLRFYSFAMLCFAVLTLAYFILILVMETNLTGSPIGSRFNRFWVPIRLTFALGLLLPVGPHSLNSAQYIVLYTAKVGSAFATNGWIYYNEFTRAFMNGANSGNPLGMQRSYTYDPRFGPTIANSSPLAAKLNAPDLGDFVRFLHLVFACEYYYEQKAGKQVQGYFVKTDGTPATVAYVEPTPGNNGQYIAYDAALNYFDYGNINIVFGEQDMAKYSGQPGGVLPLCGSVVIPITSVNNPNTGQIENPGAARANELYYNYALALMDKSTYPRQLMDGFASIMVEHYAKISPNGRCKWDSNDADSFLDQHPNNPGTNMPELGPCTDDPIKTYLPWQIEMFQVIFQTLVNDANLELSDPQYWAIQQNIINRGWAGAGIWPNAVATQNGAFVSSVQQIPYGATLPDAMNKARMIAQMTIPNIQDYKMVLQLLKNQKNPMKGTDIELNKAMDPIYQYLFGDDTRYAFRPDPGGQPGVSGLNGYTIVQTNTQKNPIIDAINIVLGSQFLFNFRDNQDTHPLAQLVTFGRTLLERSGRNLMTGSAIATMGGVMNLGNEDIGSGLKKTSAFFFATASIFFWAGFVLFYILPLLPFIYFFFAMLSWVKAIFEAMLGAPLWALSHMRLKGAGFPSSPSRGGYLLLMEIFLRPITTVFGLIAALGIFTASIYMLNDLFNFVVSNATGMDFTDFGNAKGAVPTEFTRGSLDQLFFNILYVILVYMFANSCFQLIDRIPNGFMRWFGGGMKSFSAEAYRRDSPAGNFLQTANVAVIYPVKGLIPTLGEEAANIATTAVKAADEASAAKGQPTIATSIRESFGKDRNTFINDTVEGIAKTYRTAKEEAEHLESQAEAAKKAGKATEAAKLETKAKEARARAEANDPDLLLEEALNPGKSKMSPMARMIAADNIEKMKKVHSVAQDLLDSGGVLRQGSGPDAKAIAGGRTGYHDKGTMGSVLGELFMYAKLKRPK